MTRDPAIGARCDWPDCKSNWTHHHEPNGEEPAFYCDEHAVMAAHGFVPHEPLHEQARGR